MALREVSDDVSVGMSSEPFRERREVLEQFGGGSGVTFGRDNGLSAILAVDVRDLIRALAYQFGPTSYHPGSLRRCAVSPHAVGKRSGGSTYRPVNVVRIAERNISDDLGCGGVHRTERLAVA